MRYRFFFASTTALLLLPTLARAEDPPSATNRSTATTAALSSYVAPTSCETAEAFRAHFGERPPSYDVKIVREEDRYEGTVTIPTATGPAAARSFSSGSCDDVTRGLVIAIELATSVHAPAPPPDRSPARPATFGPPVTRPTSVAEYKAAFEALAERRRAEPTESGKAAIALQERKLKVAYGEDTTLRSKPARIGGFVVGGLGMGAIGLSLGFLFASRMFETCDRTKTTFQLCVREETRADYDRGTAIGIASGAAAVLLALPLVLWGSKRVMREEPVLRASIGLGTIGLSGSF